MTALIQQLVFILKWQTVYSAIVFAVLLPAIFILRKRHPVFLLSVYWLILIRLMLPPAFSLPFSGRAVLDRLHVFDRFSAINLFFESADQSRNDNTGISIHDGPERSSGEKNAKAPTLFERTLFISWLFSACGLLAYFLLQKRKFRKIVKLSGNYGNGRSELIVEYWKKQFIVARNISLIISDYPTPFTHGILRPVIHLPSSILLKKNWIVIESVIAHEMAHIKRFDTLWLNLQNILQLIYFFNPLVWFVNSQIRQLTETICDQMVLSDKRISAETYGQGILAISRLQTHGLPDLAMLPGFSAGGRKIIHRIQRLKGDHQMKTKHLLFALLLFLSAGIFVLPLSTVAENPPEKEVTLSSNSMGATSKTTLVETNAPILKDNFGMPVEKSLYKVTAGFGPMKDPISGKDRFHNGIDLSAKRGTPIHAAASGKVVTAMTEFTSGQGSGRYIEIQHENNLKTVYTQLDSVLVSEDQSVKKGEIIGLVGSSGRSTGPHLHFEIRLNDQAVNPEDYINFR
jgi:beta-lactamase regulating signal transducer with metallopeptidase domain